MRWYAAVCLLALCVAHGSAAAQAPGAEPSGAVTHAEPPTAPHKVAIVVAGDPDALLTDAASEVGDALASSPGLMLTADAELSRALRGGQSPEVDDGLAEVRALRRRLGISADADRDVLSQLGRLAGAVAVVVLARRPDPRIEVFDVGRSAFFADALAVAGAEPAAIHRFVLRRAGAAQRHVGEARPTRHVADSPEAAADAASTAEAAAETEDAQPNARRRFMRRNIAYIAAGALLVGAGVFLLVDRLKDDPAPIIRIRPGGG
jgi:hypothetical protein